MTRSIPQDLRYSRFDLFVCLLICCDRRLRPPPVGGSCAPPPETDDVHTEIGIGHPRYILFSEKASERYDPSDSEDISKEQHSS
jgi:hypothetical protein